MKDDKGIPINLSKLEVDPYTSDGIFPADKKPQVSHIVSICTASGQEIVGMVKGNLKEQVLTVENAAFILRPPGKIMAQSSIKHDNFMSREVIVNTAGAYIVPLHPDSMLFKLWQQTQSDILTPQRKPVQIIKGGGGRLN